MDCKLIAMRKCLNKPERTKEDLRALYEVLSKTPLNENFFKLILAVGKNEEFLHEICQGFKYKFFQKGDVIFEEGDPKTDLLYFIIRGQVGIFVKDIFKRTLDKPTSGGHLKETSGKSALNLPSLRKVTSTSRRSSLAAEESQHPFFQTIPPNLNVSHSPMNLLSPIMHTRFRSLLDNKESKSSDEDLPNDIGRLGAGFFKHMSLQNIFFPSTAEQTHISKIFHKYFLNDTSKLTDESLCELVQKYGSKICELESWRIFGERGLENSKPRSATVIATSNTEVICIKQSQYRNVIRNALRTKKLKMTEFVSETLGFAKRSQDQKFIFSLVPVIEKLKLKKGDVLAKQGSQIEKRGQLKLTKRVRNEPQSNFYESLGPEKVEMIVSRLNGKEVPIGISGSKEFIGEDILFSSNVCYEFDVQCISIDAVVIVMKSSVLKTMPSRFVEFWKQIYEQKSEYRKLQFHKTVTVMLQEQQKINVEIYRKESQSNGLLHSSDNNENVMLGNMNTLKRHHTMSQNLKSILKRYESMKRTIKTDEFYDFHCTGDDSRRIRLGNKSLITPKALARVNLESMKHLIGSTFQQVAKSGGSHDLFKINSVDARVHFQRSLCKAELTNTRF